VKLFALACSIKPSATFTRHGQSLRAEAFRQPKAIGDAVALLRCQSLRARGFDVDRGPRRAKAISRASAITHHRRTFGSD
jgi:hypothetical protein